MDAPRMLQAMCREQLSDADIKAICKQRGFSSREASSRAIFENFFLSDIGVAEALTALTAEELALLHLLKFLGDEVDAAFFARIYGDARSGSSRYGYTYNQRYTEVFKKVQTGLIRRGLLLFAETEGAVDTTTKLQRLRFRFPVEFEKFLPALLDGTRILSGDGETRSETLRNKVLELITGVRLPTPLDKSEQYQVDLVSGELRIGKLPFRAAVLYEWQKACWETAIKEPKKLEGLAGETVQSVSPTQAATYALAQLNPQQWAPPEALTIPLKIFCYGGKTADGEAVCKAGGRWGCLARQEISGQAYYRLASTSPAQPTEIPERFLSAGNDGAAVIALERIPYLALEQIAAIADLKPASSGPYLIATPNLVRLGRTTERLRRQPSLQWLREHAPAFGQAFATAVERWGKQIIHTNLWVARITDPALRVQIERALPDPGALVALSDEFIAFPNAALSTIEKAVTKAGYVIKTVQGPVEREYGKQNKD